MPGQGDAPRWRVFVSHTSELRDYPEHGTYVDAVERAISAAGHVIVDMADFAATDEAPSQLCVEKVKSADVYVGVLGMRYGSPVRDRPEVSYTELEFDTATEAGMHRLVFLIDTDADDLQIPLKALVDREFGARQDDFRQRVNDSGLTTQRFANPDQLGQLVERSLRELETRTRIERGIKAEAEPAAPSPVRASKFVNPAPMTAPTWFQDRHVETRLVADFLADPGMRLMTVIGRGGIGKTAMVCRLLKGLEAGAIPGVDADLAGLDVDGIVYLSRNGRHLVSYPNLIGDLCRLLPAELARGVQNLYQDPQNNSPADVMSALLDAFPSGGRVVVFLDNLESVMDPERESLSDPALREALVAVLGAPEHAVKVIITTRVAPTELMRVQPGVQHQLRLDEGLGSPDAQYVLRALDSDGTAGLRDAPDAMLDAVRDLTRGFPRALEVVKSIKAIDPTLSVDDVLDMIRGVGSDEVVEVLVGEAYERLDQPAQLVLQALAVYPTPVPAVGVDYLLQPYNATTNAKPILSRLVRRELARYEAGQYYLHPIDRAYARARIPGGSNGDTPPAFTMAALQAKAADFYVQIRTPAQTWRSLDDVRPQLAEFDLRCDIGDFDAAAIVLLGIDFSYLQVWGHYRTLIDLHTRIHDKITRPLLQVDHLGSFGHCYWSLGDYPKAISLHEEALRIARQTQYRQGEAVALVNLGNCHLTLGDYQKAITLYEDSVVIARQIDMQALEATALGNLGVCYSSLGDFPKAAGLHQDALRIGQETGDQPVQVNALINMGNCHLALGHYPEAITAYEDSLRIVRETGNRQGEANAVANLGNYYFCLGDYAKATGLQEDALAIVRDIGNRRGEAGITVLLARLHLARDDLAGAMSLFKEAMGIADATSEFEPGVLARSGMVRVLLEAGEPAAALPLAAAALAVYYPTEHAAVCLLEGLALLALGRAQAGAAFGQALAAADALLALAAANVTALDVRALACAGLALTDEPARASEAAQAFARARSVSSAAGVVADVARMFAVFASADQEGVLAEYRQALQEALKQ
jgi:tetratricopeptide (TPR) repeat protein